MRVRTLQFDRYRGWRQQPDQPDRGIDLVLCFGASSYLDHPEPFQDLTRAFPNAVITGCSTAGEIHGMEVHDETLSVAAIEFRSTALGLVSTEITSETSYDGGVLLAGRLASRDDLAAVFVLSDGLDVNGTELTRGINSVIPSDIPVTGGLAGDGDRFSSTWVLVGDEPRTGHVAALGLYGSRVRIGHGSKGGWTIFGPERVITRSERNVLYELDGRPALRLYKEYLGTLASGLPATGLLFPLSVRSNGDEKRLVRTILSVDEEAESLTFAGDVPEGFRAQLMQASFDRLVDGAEGAALFALEKGSEDARLSVAVSCVGRRLALGERTEDELEATLHVLPPGIAQVGFYSYGEISPFTTGECDLHNQTMTLTTIGEA